MMNEIQFRKVRNKLEKAYDNLYDVNSILNYPDDIQGIIKLLEQFLKSQKLKIELNDKTQKFRVKKDTESEIESVDDLETAVFIGDKEYAFNTKKYAIEIEELSSGSVEIAVFYRHGDLIEVMNYDE